MAADKITHRMNRRRISGFAKASLTALGLIVAGIVAVTWAGNMGQPMHAVATPAPESFTVTSNDGAITADKQLATEKFLSSNVNDKISSPISGPRDCRPEEGIVNDCNFR